jgi:hypothetical protein
MKTRHLISSPGKLSLANVRAFALGLVFASALGAQEPAPTPVQLLPNGDLETSTKEAGWPDHWSRPDAGSCSWDEEDGRRYLRLNVTEPGEVVLSYRSITIPPEVKALQLTLRARVIGLKCGPQAWFDARVMADFKTRDGEKVKGAKSIAFRKDTDGWVERSVRFAVPDGAAVLEIMPTLFRAYSGTFDVDEILVTPIDPAEINR